MIVIGGSLKSKKLPCIQKPLVDQSCKVSFSIKQRESSSMMCLSSIALLDIACLAMWLLHMLTLWYIVQLYFAVKTFASFYQ